MDPAERLGSVLSNDLALREITAIGFDLPSITVPHLGRLRHERERRPFRGALAAGDFDGDGFTDLAVGVPFDDLIVGRTTIFDAGSVHVLYGSAAGLVAAGNQLWSQNSPDILDSAEKDDLFGLPLAVGDFDGDGFDDLAIGVTFENLSGMDEAGAAHVIYGSAAGLTSDGNQFLNQTKLPEDPESGDIFASALAAGDFDGDGRDDLAVGALQETVGRSQIGAGAVHVLYGTAAGLTRLRTQLWHQNVPGVEGPAEEGDFFGSAATTADFDGDGLDDLAVGVQGDHGLGPNDVPAGSVNVLYGSSDGLSAAGDQLWHQDQPGVNGTAAPGELFGAALGGGISTATAGRTWRWASPATSGGTGGRPPRLRRRRLRPPQGRGAARGGGVLGRR